jgi:hypothetical protein
MRYALPFLLVALAACDAGTEPPPPLGPPDNISGQWEGETTFEEDVTSADGSRQAVDLRVTLALTLTDDDGAVTGSVRAVYDGFTIAQMAGGEPDTTFYDAEEQVGGVSGTYQPPTATLTLSGIMNAGTYAFQLAQPSEGAYTATTELCYSIIDIGRIVLTRR